MSPERQSTRLEGCGRPTAAQRLTEGDPTDRYCLEAPDSVSYSWSLAARVEWGLLGLFPLRSALARRMPARIRTTGQHPLPRLESHRPSGRNDEILVSEGAPPDPRLPRCGREHPESAELYAFAATESVLNREQDALHRYPGEIPAQACRGRDLFDDIGLVHRTSVLASPAFPARKPPRLGLLGTDAGCRGAIPRFMIG